MEQTLRAYLLGQLKALLAIDSTTGMSKAVEQYLFDETTRLGYAPARLNKGGVTAHVGGEGNRLVLTAHADDIGLVVRFINPNGTIRVINAGGLYPWQCEQANVRLHTRGGRVYTGTMRRANSSLHLMNADERAAAPDYDKNLFLFLDEDVESASDVEALGIRCGDLIALEPNTVFTDSGYIKSRYLDDKVSAAVLLAFMKSVRDERTALPRAVTAHFSLYEEVGHGGGSGLPPDTREVLAVDIGCCGPINYSHEKKVSICAMDTFSPYHRDVTDALIQAAERSLTPYTLDLFVPHYGSDADAALRTGADIRHGLIGPGVLGTHGYERTHIEGIVATYGLIRAYVCG